MSKISNNRSNTAYCILYYTVSCDDFIVINNSVDTRLKSTTKKMFMQYSTVH